MLVLHNRIISTEYKVSTVSISVNIDNSGETVKGDTIKTTNY